MGDCWWPEVREGDLVSYLSDDEHARLLSVMETVEVGEGDSILTKGSPSRSLLLVEEGEVDVVEESMGETVVLATIGAGGVVGEVGFVDGRARTHDVVAATGCRLRRLTRDKLLELVRDDTPLFAKLTIALAEVLAARFRAAVAELEPVRAFAATLREPMEPEGGPEVDVAGCDEINEPVPEEALEMLKEIALKSRKDIAAV